MEGLTTSTLFACSAARLFLLANILTGSQTAWRVCKVKAMATSKLQKERRVLQAPEATAGGLASDHSDDERQSQPLESQNPEKRRKRWPLLSGWWWETGSLVLCIISMALSATVFLCMADKPLRTWRLPIQPNSLIAVFSTITKAALLFPLSECIGQLKWGFFRQPRRLSDMHAFDIASRGPWGATVFLWETNAIASPLASVGAAVTILLLAFEPFMQQVIVFESRIAPLHNITTAAVSTTKSWPNGEDGPFGGVAPIENCRSTSLSTLAEMQLLFTF